jgi:hypothetical protein
MSYTRNYHETIVVRGTESKTVSYPKSESGGSMTVSVNYSQTVPISVNILVDTNSFDNSISSANGQINLLTGAVVTTEAVHIAAKIKKSKDISHAVVNGFFGLIRSEIDQQLTEIKPRTEALFVELGQYQKACLEKKLQLQNDFERISERYSKIFEELDKELKTRIFNLNRMAIGVHHTLANHVQRFFTGRSPGISTIYNKEGSRLQSMLFLTGLKQRALGLIDHTKSYLSSEKRLSNQVTKAIHPAKNGEMTTPKAPVLYFEAGKNVQVIYPDALSFLKGHSSTIKQGFSNARWNTSRDQIDAFFKSELANKSTDTTMSPRVLSEIARLWTKNIDIRTNS